MLGERVEGKKQGWETVHKAGLLLRAPISHLQNEHVIPYLSGVTSRHNAQKHLEQSLERLQVLSLPLWGLRFLTYKNAQKGQGGRELY